MINPEQPDYTNTPVAQGRPGFLYRPVAANPTPTVSVITPYYNTDRVFLETAQSLFGQSFQDFEWIIVDDGSNDKSALARLHTTRDSDIRIKVIVQENSGPAASRNTAFRHCSGRYLCLLDSDDMLEPTFIEKCLWFLESNSDFGFCNTWSVNFGDEEFLWRVGFERASAYLQANSGPPISLVRREVFEAGGGFDESIRFGHEDWDFWLALAKAGYWGHTLPEFQEWYRKRSTGRFYQVMNSDTVHRDFEASIARKYAMLQTSFPAPAIKPAEPYENVPYEIPFENQLAKPLNIRGILFLVPWMVTGGADKVNLDWIAALTRNGYQVTICATLEANHNWLSEFARLTPDIFILPNFLRCADYPRFLRYLIHSRKIETVLITGSTFGYLVLPFLRTHFPGTTFVDLCHVEEAHWMNGGHPRFGVGYQEMLHLNMVTTLHLHDWMVGRGASPERIEVCHSGINVSKLDVSALTKEQARDELGFSADSTVIVFAGRICVQKRPMFLADILHGLASRREKFQVLVIGDGEMRSAFENRLIEANLMSKVCMMGTLGHEAWLRALSASDVFLLPSQYEGISVALLEAMGMGVVPVTAAVGGQDELLNADCGFLIPHIDRELDAYVDALVRLIDDIPLRQGMGRAARERILDNFSLDASTTGLLAGLERARKLAEPRSHMMMPIGFAQELATLAVEYTRLSGTASFLWNHLEITRQKLVSVETSNSQSLHELENARYVLNQTYHDLQQSRHELDQSRHEQAKIHLSRAYKLAGIFQDFRSGKRGKLLLPFRLIWLTLPLNIKKRWMPAAHYVKTQMWLPRQPKSIENQH
ncbi:MAG: glycosyltransferase [Deltaproteobacteria bacterium]